MPVTRKILPGPGPDELGFQAHVVTGSNAGESYVTRVGDTLVNMLGGNDTVTVKNGWSNGELSLTVRAGAGDDIVRDENDRSGDFAYGDAGRDRILADGGSGDGGADGGAGNDVLRSGGGGIMTLRGGPGDDVIYSHESGDHHLNGGGGLDRFFLAGNEDTLTFFANHTGVGAKRDVARSFDPGEDKIDLHGMDARRDAGHPGNQDFAFDGEVPGGGSPVAPGHVAWFHEGENIGVAWNNGEADAANGREAVLLLDMIGKGLDASDFML